MVQIKIKLKKIPNPKSTMLSTKISGRK